MELNGSNMTESDNPNFVTMKTNPLKIVIIDNDEKLHPHYQFYFNDEPNYELVETYTSVSTYLSTAMCTNPDIIISEVNLTGISGIDGIQHFKVQNAATKVLMISRESSFDIIKEAFKKGANGFLTKPLSKKRLFNAIEELHQHGVALEHDVARKIVHSFQIKTFERFSKKENQIIELLTHGYTYKMIADRLCVTPSAVNFHIQNIYVKLNVNSKSEALKKLQEMEVQQLNAA